MKRPIDPSPQLQDLAAAQGGMVTSSQAAGLGVGRHSLARLIRCGRWRRVGPSVIFVHDTDPPWTALAWAGVLLGGPEARVGGRAAAYLHGLCGEPPDQIVIMVPHQRQPTDRRRGPSTGNGRGSARKDHRAIRPGFPSRMWCWTSAPTPGRRCTGSPPRYSAAAPRRAGLRAALGRRGRITHRRLLTELIEDVREGAQSPLEVTYLRDVERAHGLPRGRRQLRRDNAALVDGHSTLRYGWSDLTTDPCLVARQVAEILVRRGWLGMPANCALCRAVPFDDAGWNLAG